LAIRSAPARRGVSRTSTDPEDIVFADFQDSLWDDRSRRRWTSLACFVVEIGIAAGLLLLPLLHPQTLPPLRSIASFPVVATPPGRARAPARPKGVLVKTMRTLLLTPTRIPREISKRNESDAPPPPAFLSGNGTQGERGSMGVGNSLWEGLGTGPGPYLAPPNPAAANHPLRISHSMEGSLIHQVQPQYPTLAKQARIQGTVVLRAIIDREGKIEKLQVLSGHPMLAEAAVRAVQQWRYRPYYLNEQAVEVETEITVHFTLSGG
jgi:periplasmic protein TonB